MLEIVMLLVGIVTLVTGRMQLGNGREILGWRARLCGAIICSHVPMMFCCGLVMGVTGYTDPTLQVVLPIISMAFFVILAVLLGNFLYSGQKAETTVLSNS